MKKITITILLTVLTAVTFGQITTTKIALKSDQFDNTPYDSLQNFLAKDVFKYLGQDLYLKGIEKSLRGLYGYDGFSKDYTKSTLGRKSNVYKCCDGYKSKYDELVGKYFKAIKIINHPKANESEYLYGTKFYLKLQEKESSDIVYFEYDSKFESSFPFVVVGFFEKQKKLVIGQEYVFADKFIKYRFFRGPKPSLDINTGKELTIITGDKWKCVDLTIEEEYYTLSLVISNSLGERTTMDYNTVFGEWSKGRAYKASDADNYKKIFGNDIFDIILKGKCKIGMTKEMCRLSWGEPKSINETITSGKKSEQWVYSDNYLYFDNDTLTAMQ